MATLLNKNSFLSDPIVITIDDDEEEIPEIADKDVQGNINNLSQCISVQEERDIIQIIDESSLIELPSLELKNISQKRSAIDEEVSKTKRLKVDENNSNQKPKKILPCSGPTASLTNHYVFFNENCDYYIESVNKVPTHKVKAKGLRKIGDVIVTAIELVKNRNKTLEQLMTSWNLRVKQPKNAFEKFISNCRTVCAANKCLDVEMKEGLVISLSYDYPHLTLKNAANKIMSTMKRITSTSKCDSQISEANLKYLRAIAASAVQMSASLKLRGWQVKEMTDKIRKDFFQDGKPIFLSTCCAANRALKRQKVLANGKKVISAAVGNVNLCVDNGNQACCPVTSLDSSSKNVGSVSRSTFHNTSGLVSIPKTDSVAEGREKFLVNNGPRLELNNASGSANCSTNSSSNIQIISQMKDLNQVSNSALNKENKSGTSQVNPMLALNNSAITKTILNNLYNKKDNAPPHLNPELNFSRRNNCTMISKTISNVNNRVFRKNQLNSEQDTISGGNQNSPDFIPLVNNNVCQLYNMVNQLIVYLPENGIVNSLRTLGDNTQNYLMTGDLNRNYQYFQNYRRNLNCFPRSNIPFSVSKLRPIAIDGSNVAYSHGTVGHKFSCKGIELCVEHFLRMGHTKVKAFVPHYRLKSNAEVVNGEILHKLGNKQIVVFTPSRKVDGKMIVCYDDRFILDYAVESGAVVVSNDNFRDLLNESPQYNFIIKNRLLMYTFVEDFFIIPKDPLGRHGPNLEAFLKF